MNPENKPFPNLLWRDLKHEWLWVYRGRSATEKIWSPRIIVPAGVFFVEAGQVTIRADGVVTHVLSGQAFLSAPGPREHYFEKGSRLCSVGMRNAWTDGTTLFKDGLNRLLTQPEAASLFKATIHLFHSIHPNKKEVSYPTAVKAGELSVQDLAKRDAAFYGWFAVYVETLAGLGISPDPRHGKDAGRIHTLLTWLNELHLDKAGPLIPPELGIGLRRANQLLQNHLGIGLKSFLNQRKMIVSKKMLLSNSLSVKEIGFRLGFRHASHFTAWFKRNAGVSPSVFRHNGVFEMP